MVSWRKAANWLSVIFDVSRPAISTVPLVGRSRPPMMFSSVDLPEPEGPIWQTNSPGCTSRLTFTSARTISSPSLCSFQASVTLTTGAPGTATLSEADSVTVIGSPAFSVSRSTCAEGLDRGAVHRAPDRHHAGDDRGDDGNGHRDDDPGDGPARGDAGAHRANGAEHGSDYRGDHGPAEGAEERGDD